MESEQRILICLVLIFVFSQNVSTADMTQMYTNCSGLKLLNDDLQPKYSQQTSFIRKCCPLGQSYEFDDEKEKTTRRCAANNVNFSVSVINALFYENCIEDTESAPTLGYNYVNACKEEDMIVHMLLYAKAYGDDLYVLQNGSLLIVEENFEAFEVHNDNYCLDSSSEGLYAIVCQNENNLKAHVLRGEAVINAVCLWVSVPCLLLTAFFYLKISELRELHGKTLACHCTCLALAYIFLGIVQIQFSIRIFLTYIIQYFLLACICWLSALCCDICIKISYIYVKRVSCSIDTEAKYFRVYAFSCSVLPLLPVLFAITQHKGGIPHYYIKGQPFNNIFTGYSFILPSAVLLFFCWCCICATFYAFHLRQPKLPNEHWTPEAVTEYEEFFKLKRTAKSIAFLLGVVTVCRLIELMTFKLNAAIISSDTDTISPFAFFDILIALQGVFIFIIFVCSTTALRIIKRWWVSTGSLDLAANTELKSLKKHEVQQLSV